MTSTRFDAPASKTQPRRSSRTPQTYRGSVAYRIVRLVWLTAVFARRESVTIADYRRRFGVSLRSFHRDMAALRQAGFYIAAPSDGSYRALCFLADADHA